MKEILNIKIYKKVMHGFFSEFYEPPDIQKNIFAL